MAKKNTIKTYYATLATDFTFTHPLGEVITWKAGKRFRIGETHYYGTFGELYVANYFAYGYPLEIPAEFLRPRTAPMGLVERYLGTYVGLR
jgi:hypothetical protein